MIVSIKLLLRTNKARSRLKTIFIFFVIVALLLWWASSIRADANTVRKMAEVAPRLRLLTLLQMIGVGVITWAMGSLYRFMKKWNQAQDMINRLPGVKLSIAVPRELGDDVRAETDFWRRLASYLPRPEELPCPHISFEVSGNRDVVLYSVFIPGVDGLDKSLREEIIREWPGTQLRELVVDLEDVPPAERDRVFPDPAGFGDFKAPPIVAWNEFKLTGKGGLPLYQDTGTGARGKDPIEAFLGALSVIDSEAVMGIQFLVRPALANMWERWQEEIVKKEKQVARMKQAKQAIPKNFMQEAELIEKRLEKATIIWEVGIRAWTATIDPKLAYHDLDRLSKVLLAQTRGKYNQLTIAKNEQEAAPVSGRYYPGYGGIPLTDLELGRVIHLPSAKVAAPYRKLYRAGSSRLPPDPRGIIRDDRGGKRAYGTYEYDTGETVFFGHDLEFARMGTFIAGATGTGKSTVLANLVLQDFLNGAGGVVLDPHVDFIREVMENIPPDRLEDVIIFDIRDKQPLLYNICNVAGGLGPAATVESIMGAIQVVMGANWSTSVRMQELLFNGFYLAVGALGEKASVMQVSKLLQDEFFREDLMNAIRDPVQFGATIDFWRNNFGGWSDTDKINAVTVALRRLNAITSRPSVRRSLAMPMSTLNLADQLNRGRLILVPLHISMGADAQKLLGALLIRDFYNAMLMRESIPKAERRNAVLVMDEMASFVGDMAGFVEKLAAQCRKYGSALIGATQFYKQLPSSILNEVLENFRTQMALSGGADYARTVTQIMGGEISISDVQNLPPYMAYTKTAVFGGTTSPCLVQTLPPAKPYWKEPKAVTGYGTEPEQVWSPLLPGAEPITRPPNSPKDTMAPELFAYASRLAGQNLLAAIDYAASLPTDVFNALLITQRQYDAWKRQEILNNPGIMAKRPIARLYALSRLEFGIRNYMMDAWYVRDYYRRPGSNGAVSKNGATPADSEDGGAADFFEDEFYYDDEL